MEASLDKPFRARRMEAGQDTHAQLGPGQEMVVRWASSHNNTFTFVVVKAANQEVFWREDYFKMVDDYIAQAPPGANMAQQRPRWHGAPGKSSYIDGRTFEACANGYCVDRLFTSRLDASNPDYVAHFDDMSGRTHNYQHVQWEYNSEVIADDRRVQVGATGAHCIAPLLFRIAPSLMCVQAHCCVEHLLTGRTACPIV